jgi:hypothetical protein
VTVKLQEVLLPRASVTVPVTVVTPSGNVAPEAGRLVTVTGLPQVLEIVGGG